MKLAAPVQAWLARRVRQAEKPLPVRHGDCANCGAAVAGAYCARCGQETAIELPTARRFLRDAAGRYVALDGRLWRTLATLTVQPGSLTREYLAGRRRRYVRPGRLFLVLSLALFAVLRFNVDGPVIIWTQDDAAEPGAALAGASAPAANAAGVARNETAASSESCTSRSWTKLCAFPDAPGAAAGASSTAGAKPGGTPGSTLALGVDDNFNLTLDEAASPWLAPLRPRLDGFNRLTREQKSEQLVQGVLRFGPYAMVALLPVFAALMQLAYLGRTRRHSGRPSRYAAHLVFGAHNHAFLMVAALAFSVLALGPVRAFLVMWTLAYLPWSMRTVYGGPWIGVILRALLVAFAYAICFAVACAGLLVSAAAFR